MTIWRWFFKLKKGIICSGTWKEFGIAGALSGGKAWLERWAGMLVGGLVSHAETGELLEDFTNN